jgi:hypothetical protein
VSGGRTSDAAYFWVWGLDIEGEGRGGQSLGLGKQGPNIAGGRKSNQTKQNKTKQNKNKTKEAVETTQRVGGRNLK